VWRSYLSRLGTPNPAHRAPDYPRALVLGERLVHGAAAAPQRCMAVRQARNQRKRRCVKRCRVISGVFGRTDSDLVFLLRLARMLLLLMPADVRRNLIMPFPGYIGALLDEPIS